MIIEDAFSIYFSIYFSVGGGGGDRRGSIIEEEESNQDFCELYNSATSTKGENFFIWRGPKT
jgi:hypothetical protein